MTGGAVGDKRVPHLLRLPGCGAISLTRRAWSGMCLDMHALDDVKCLEGAVGVDGASPATGALGVSETAESNLGVRLVMRNLAVDKATVEVVQELEAEGIETLVLKGPVLASWLYPDRIRTYGDSDLMVAPQSYDRAVGVLERLGFVAHRPWRPPSLSSLRGGNELERGGVLVDVHWRLPGLTGDPGAVWARVFAGAARQRIRGVELRVPGRDALLMHVALHAAQHANLALFTAAEDLRRAILRAGEQDWLRALALAKACGGLPAFAAGVQCVPGGVALAERLGIEGAATVGYALHREGNIAAEEMGALFSSGVGVWHKLTVAARELFPSAEYMRWLSPSARRSRLALAAAYLWRPFWAIGRVACASGALARAWRFRRRSAK